MTWLWVQSTSHAPGLAENREVIKWGSGISHPWLDLSVFGGDRYVLTGVWPTTFNFHDQVIVNINSELELSQVERRYLLS